MIVKRAGGKVYGAIFTAAEKKAMKLEVNRQVVETEKNYYRDLDATILYILHTQFGFGAKRLKKFFMDFGNSRDELARHYEMSVDEDGTWLCEHKLKDCGVDLDAWYKEKEELESGNKSSFL